MYACVAPIAIKAPSSRVDDVPESSKSLFAARIASSVDRTFASATAIDAAPTDASLGAANGLIYVHRTALQKRLGGS